MRRSFNYLHRREVLLIGAALALVIGIWGCSGTDDAPLAPAQTSTEVVLDELMPKVKSVMAVQDRHTAALMAKQDVIGTATTVDDNGQPAILLLVTSKAAMDAAPSTLDGVPVKVLLTDKIVAMRSSGVSHKAKQTPPIQLGTSGGWRYDLANGYCCGGTLGSLVQKGGTQYIMSNYHVLEADIVSGGNSRTAQPGDPVIQPGLIDVNCNAANAQNVGTLSGVKSLPNSNVDAAFAAVIANMVRTDGAILEVGTLSASTVAASLNQKVKKSGRTTGLSRATVSGLNATISVSYENECAGGFAFTKTFTGQILTTNSGSKFLAGGDSGSLMVEDITTRPRAVGLLFAGSSSVAVANPINQVLSFFGATMVGN